MAVHFLQELLVGEIKVGPSRQEPGAILPLPDSFRKILNSQCIKGPGMFTSSVENTGLFSPKRRAPTCSQAALHLTIQPTLALNLQLLPCSSLTSAGLQAYITVPGLGWLVSNLLSFFLSLYRMLSMLTQSALPLLSCKY